MLRSLFGDLYPMRDSSKSSRHVEFAATEFAATAVLEHATRSVSDVGQIVDRHTQDLFVSGPPAAGMRAHFASVLASSPPGQRFITLVDPAQMWAPSVIKALSEAGGQAIERLHLRDRATLQTLAMIERTTLHRRTDEALKVYHANVRAHGRDAAAISLALMERADMTVVVVGPLHPSVIEEQIRILRTAASGDAWRCREVLFMLPVGAGWVADRLERLQWPAGMHVHSIMEPMTSASTVWNALLAHWNKVRPDTAATRALAKPRDDGGTALQRSGRIGERADFTTTGFGNAPLLHELSLHSAPMGLYPQGPQGPQDLHANLSASAQHRLSHLHPPVRLVNEAVEMLGHVDGLQFVAVIDIASALVLASSGDGRHLTDPGDLGNLAQGVCDLVKAHRLSLKALGHARSSDMVDEILVTAGSVYHIIRGLQAYPDCFVLGIADKLRCNLAMTRFRIMEAQKTLV